MKCRILVVAAVAGILLGAVGQAPAQSHSGGARGRGHIGGSSSGGRRGERGSVGGGGNDLGILPGLDDQQAADIRRTLSSEAQRRADTLLGQQQATQDWLLQQRTQQRKQRGTAVAEIGTPGNSPTP